MKTAWWLLLTLSGLGAAAPGVRAQELTPLDTASFRIGGFITTFDTDVSVDGTTQRGTPINLGTDLGLDDSSTIGYVGVTWRPWEHHEFGLTYYQFDADSTRTTTRDFTFRDTTYTANSVIAADFALDGYEAYYTWWAASNERWALGPRVGLVWFSLDLSVALLVDANGNTFGGARRGDASADLPSPVIGGSWRWVPGPNWRVYADAGYLTANIDNVDADILYGRIGVEWFPWERSGFSLDYTISQIDATLDESDFDGTTNLDVSGIRLGYVYRW
jgi:hypothetical protein